MRYTINFEDVDYTVHTVSRNLVNESLTYLVTWKNNEFEKTQSRVLKISNSDVSIDVIKQKIKDDVFQIHLKQHIEKKINSPLHV